MELFGGNIDIGWHGWVSPAATCARCGNRIRRWPIGIYGDEGERYHIRCLERRDHVQG